MLKTTAQGKDVATHESETSSIDYSYLPELVGHLLGLAHVRVTQICTEIMQPLDLTPKQFVTLEFVSKNPEIPQKDIAYHVGTSPPMMVNILDELDRHKLVQRVRSQDDRRRQFVRVTDKGTTLLENIKQKAFEVEDIFAAEANLTNDERETLLKLLKKLANR
jgi:MarR family transcriptional regulator, organic hydroperoxide resistance regulator